MQFNELKTYSGYNLDESIESLVATTKKVGSLPILGVFDAVSADQNDFDSDKEQVDLGQEPLSELNSLATRYSKELKNTDSLIQQQKASKLEITERFNAIDETIRSAEAFISRTRKRSEQHILQSLYAVCALIT
jgi:hypothetical protein